MRCLFVSCLLFYLTSCSGIAGLAFTAASSAKSAYDGVTYADEKGWFKYKKGTRTKNTWYQIHEDGIWFGTYIRLERTVLLRIYGNPRDKDLYK
jgi:hypothetical protein